MRALLVLQFCLVSVLASEADVERQKVYTCPTASQLDHDQHEKFLNTLNGTKIVFLGDSITRFQYLTLANFLARGVCPSRPQMIYKSLFRQKKMSWDDFFMESSTQLDTPVSSETCFCDGLSNKGDRREERVFLYKDDKVNLEPTHLVMNFGLWMMGSDRDCGSYAGGICPELPEVCEFLNAEHPFKVIWQTTTSTRSKGDSIVDHHLHIPSVCNLTSSMVLHRGLIFKALADKRQEWVTLFHDNAHFVPAAYHAFNGVLLDMIIGDRISGPPTQDGEQILHSG